MVAKLIAALDFLDALTAGVVVFFFCSPTWPAACVAGVLIACVSARRVLAMIFSGKALEARMAVLEALIKRISNKVGIGI